MAHKKYSTDVVVAGAGAAGMAAAITSAQKGLKVIQIESGKNSGGNAQYTEGIFAVNSKPQKEAGINIDKDKIIHKELEYSKYRANGRIWKNYIDASASTIEWLMSLGVSFDTVQQLGDGEKTWHNYHGGGHELFGKYLIPEAEKLGVTTIHEADVDHINLDDLNQVTGVEISKRDGTTITIEAKAVVLGTGGYLNNNEMMDKLSPDFYDLNRLIVVNGGHNRGKALQAAWNVGAKQYGTGTAMLFGPEINDKTRPPYQVFETQLNCAVREPLLWVNESGNRFMDEGAIANESLAGNAIFTQAKTYSIMSQNVVDYLTDKGAFIGSGLAIRPGQKFDTLQSELDDALDKKKDFIVKADSLDELASQTGIPVANLKKTVAQYNESYTLGQDQQFNKKNSYIVPLENGPYYAIEFYGGAFCTIGGLKVTEKNEVFSRKNEVIPGLYATGNDAQAIVGDSYGMVTPGGCVGYAFYSGRNAAQNIVSYLKLQQLNVK